MSKIIEFEGRKYLYCGNVPKGTFADPSKYKEGNGWQMRPGLILRCTSCGGCIKFEKPEKSGNVHCECGAIHHDYDWGRVGSGFGDDAVEVYELMEELM